MDNDVSSKLFLADFGVGTTPECNELFLNLIDAGQEKAGLSLDRRMNPGVANDDSNPAGRIDAALVGE